VFEFAVNFIEVLKAGNASGRIGALAERAQTRLVQSLAFGCGGEQKDSGLLSSGFIRS
jgi:hypothetical protein